MSILCEMSFNVLVTAGWEDKSHLPFYPPLVRQLAITTLFSWLISEFYLTNIYNYNACFAKVCFLLSFN